MPPINVMIPPPLPSTENVDIQTEVSLSDLDQTWNELRADEDIQFDEIEVPPEPAHEPSWLEEALTSLGEALIPLFSWFPAFWPVLKWVLIGIAAIAAIFIIYRLIEPYLQWPSTSEVMEESPMEWSPNAEQSSALLSDADKLAALGKYDEAAHLLLQRSVTHLSEARPDWVEPSSTARELSAIKGLPIKASQTFEVIAQAVERSLFALSPLNKDDWEVARAAYADFAATTLRGSAS